MNRYFLVVLCFFLSAQLLFAGQFNVRDFGATGQKKDLVTKALQAAIDSCYFAGGGTVYLPPGDYTSGTIILKSNITFHLEAGATLWASQNIDDYRIPLESAIRPVLIYANGAQHLSITGKGTINGQARRNYLPLKKVDRWIPEITENARQAGVEMEMYYVEKPDVSMFTLVKCTDLTITDVTLYESTFWTLHIISSERVFIRGIYVYSSLESGVNADGIDINGCKDVTISDCVITTGDDAIVIKTWYDHPAENITVTNCVLTSSSTALKLGTESESNFSNIVFSNCVIRNSNRGLSIVVRDGAKVENVLFSNITIDCQRRHFNWWGSADPIWIIVGKRNKNSAVGSIHNVVFENIIAHGQGTSVIESPFGQNIHNVQFNNVQFFMHPESLPDKRATHALHASHVDGLELNHVSVSWDQENPEPAWESALVIENTNNLIIDRFKGQTPYPDFPVLRLTDVTNAQILRSTGQGQKFLEACGTKSQNILFDSRLLGDDGVRHNTCSQFPPKELTLFK